jgi:hypothetical protein
MRPAQIINVDYRQPCDKRRLGGPAWSGHDRGITQFAAGERMTEVQSAQGTTDITPLLRPLGVGRLTLKNRFVMPGMQRAWCENGAPTAKLRDYYRRRAEGGTALALHPSDAGVVTRQHDHLRREFPSGSALTAGPCPRGCSCSPPPG